MHENTHIHMYDVLTVRCTSMDEWTHAHNVACGSRAVHACTHKAIDTQPQVNSFAMT